MLEKKKNIGRKTFRILLYIFAFIGFVFTGVFFAMQLHITDVKGSIDSRNAYFDSVRSQLTRTEDSQKSFYDWISSPEWQVIRGGLLKDKDIILEASKNSGVPARIIISTMVAEQFRFFTSNRESFKKFFEPLKILANGTKFSYGVTGVKETTAQKIEENLKNIDSPFYLGTDYENVLDFTTSDPNTERLNRLTDAHNHYYSYLYTGLFIKEVTAQWQKAGFPVGDRPEVLATIFNLGFEKSIPKANPQVGGAPITINGREYTFGGLAYQFYYSGDLFETFPFEVQ